MSCPGTASTWRSGWPSHHQANHPNRKHQSYQGWTSMHDTPQCFMKPTQLHQTEVKVKSTPQSILQHLINPLCPSDVYLLHSDCGIHANPIPKTRLGTLCLQNGYHVLLQETLKESVLHWEDRWTSTGTQSENNTFTRPGLLAWRRLKIFFWPKYPTTGLAKLWMTLVWADSDSGQTK